MTWGKHYWPVFLIISSVWLLLGFGIPESWALFIEGGTGVHIDNTLSVYARTELNVSLNTNVHTVAWYLTFLMWMMFVVFITAHIWFDQFG
jgi:hypothetical protein